MKRSSNSLVRAFEGEQNMTRTENGALTNRSTFSGVLDFFYHAPVRRGQDNTGLFSNAYAENRALAVKALFYLRDVRQGKGERDTFRQIMKWLAKNDPRIFDQLVDYVPEYGRWDDLTEAFVGYRSVQALVSKTLQEDYESTDGVSLLGKWMPSENAGKESRKLALRWMATLGVTPKMYRNRLVALREKIGIPETTMSQGDWDEIDYSKVPARAMKLYSRAFSRHDGTRFGKYLQKAIRGDVEIKTSGIYPHELVSTVRKGQYSSAVEAQWRQLKNYFSEGAGDTLVVVDTSSSMSRTISKSGVTAMDVSIALGMYCAEHNTGAFSEYVMTFNDVAEIVKVVGRNLEEKYHCVKNIRWGGSTNLQSVFDTVLNLAVANGVPQEDMPANIFVISDMEFNPTRDKATNLNAIRAKFEQNGYEMPKLTFWNVDSRHDQTPATREERGVFLVSGFSSETIGKILNSNSITPEDLMLETLNSERYSFVDDIL